MINNSNFISDISKYNCLYTSSINTNIIVGRFNQSQYLRISMSSENMLYKWRRFYIHLILVVVL